MAEPKIKYDRQLRYPDHSSLPNHPFALPHSTVFHFALKLFSLETVFPRKKKSILLKFDFCLVPFLFSMVKSIRKKKQERFFLDI